MTNNATLQNDSALSFNVSSGETWYVELMLSYSGNNATGDYKCDFSFPLSSGWVRYVGDNTAADAINVSTGIRLAAASNLASIALGTDAADTPRVLMLEMMIRPTANGTVQFRFANNTAAAGRTSTTRAGTILHATSWARRCRASTTHGRNRLNGAKARPDERQRPGRADPRELHTTQAQLLILGLAFLAAAGLVVWLLVGNHGQAAPTKGEYRRSSQARSSRSLPSR